MVTQDNPIIQVKDVFKFFKDIKAVNGIKLRVYPGQFVAILGPNGAGKTTLVEMIEGIQKPDSGEILIKGKPWKGNHTELNRILGISLQETWFVEKLTVFETLRLFASFYKLKDDRVNEVLGLIKLEEKRKVYVKNLSGGQRQRLALGIALLNYPEVLLLDEPTTGLDPNARRDIWEILLKLKKEYNTALLLTTHYMEEAQYLCEQIVVIDQGKILAKGTLGELLTSCDLNEIIEVAFTHEPTFDLSEISGVKKVSKEEKNGNYKLDVEHIMKTLPEILKKAEKENVEIQSIQSRSMTLDDLFITMTGRHLDS